MLKVHSFMVKSLRVGGGGLLDYIVSYLGKPRSLTIMYGIKMDMQFI